MPADIFLLREAMEGCAARPAATRATAAETEEIVGLAARTEQVDPGELAARALLNEQFHLTIAVATHGPRIERLIRDYRSLFATPEQLRQLPEADTRRLLSEHTGIADAIARRLLDMAEQRTRGHLRALHPVGPGVEGASRILTDRTAIAAAAGRRRRPPGRCG